MASAEGAASGHKSAAGDPARKLGSWWIICIACQHHPGRQYTVGSCACGLGSGREWELQLPHAANGHPAPRHTLSPRPSSLSSRPNALCMPHTNMQSSRMLHSCMAHRSCSACGAASTTLLLALCSVYRQLDSKVRCSRIGSGYPRRYISGLSRVDMWRREPRALWADSARTAGCAGRLRHHRHPAAGVPKPAVPARRNLRRRQRRQQLSGRQREYCCNCWWGGGGLCVLGPDSGASVRHADAAAQALESPC